MKIDYLCNNPKFHETVSNWIYKEFVVKSNSKMSLEKVLEYFSNTKTDSFPITLIALLDNKCAGTITLFENDLKTQDSLRPWLGSLFVEPTYRNRGIAEKLINQLVNITRDLGYEKLYLRTEHASEYYKARNWVSLGNATDEKGQNTEIFCKQTV